MTAIWDGTERGMRKVRIMAALKCVSDRPTSLNSDRLQLDIMEWDVLLGAVCKDRHWTLVVSAF